MNIIQVPAYRGNYGQKRAYPLKYIVMHWMDGTLEGTDAWFQNPSAKASAHFGIGDTGEIHQYVPEEYNAWHAGPKVNYQSFGIEHEGGPGNDPTRSCCDASAELIAYLCTKYSLACNNEVITKHSKWMNTECPGTLDIDYIIEKANSIINGTPMPTFDYKLVARDGNIYMEFISGSASGPYTMRDVNTGEITDQGNILPTGEHNVCPNYSKRLYECDFAGIKHQIDMRDQAPPVIEITCEIKLARAEQRIAELGRENTSLKEEREVLNGHVSEKDLIIKDLTERIERLQRQQDDWLSVAIKKLILWIKTRGN